MKKILLSLFTGAFAVSAMAQHNVSTEGTRYSVIFEGTGAWCQHCGDGAVRLQAALDANPKAIGCAVHNKDAMSFATGDILSQSFVAAYPMGFIDMHYFGGPYAYVKQNGDTSVSVNRGNWGTVAGLQTAKQADFDVSMSHSYDESTRQITVTLTVKALKDMTGKYNVNVALTENNVSGPNTATGGYPDYTQISASVYNTNPNHPHYQMGTQIQGFKHQHVARAFFEGAWGMEAMVDPKKDETVTKTLTYTIPAQYDTKNGIDAKLDEMHLIGYVQDQHAGSGPSVDAKDATVHNAIEAQFLAWDPNSVAGVSQLTEVAIFPNPASNFIHVKALLAKPAASKVVLSNIVGQVFFQQEYPATSNLRENISVSDLPNGIYMVKVTSEGQSTTQRIVVNK